MITDDEMKPKKKKQVKKNKKTTSTKKKTTSSTASMKKQKKTYKFKIKTDDVAADENEKITYVTVNSSFPQYTAGFADLYVKNNECKTDNIYQSNEESSAIYMDDIINKSAQSDSLNELLDKIQEKTPESDEILSKIARVVGTFNFQIVLEILKFADIHDIEGKKLSINLLEDLALLALTKVGFTDVNEFAFYGFLARRYDDGHLSLSFELGYADSYDDDDDDAVDHIQ